MKNIISSTLYLLVLLCLSVFVFDPTHLYYELSWLDIPMHVMGGFGVASLFVAVKVYKKERFSFLSVLFVYLCVAVGWELYEFAKDIVTNGERNDLLDTVSDVINGALGACAAYLLLKK